MPLYNVKVTMETLIVVVADDEDHARQVAREEARDAFYNERLEPKIDVRGEVCRDKDLRDGWTEQCVPYGGDGNTQIVQLLTHNAKLTGDPQLYRGASSERSERG